MDQEGISIIVIASENSIERDALRQVLDRTLDVPVLSADSSLDVSDIERAQEGLVFATLVALHGHSERDACITEIRTLRNTQEWSGNYISVMHDLEARDKVANTHLFDPNYGQEGWLGNFPGHRFLARPLRLVELVDAITNMDSFQPSKWKRAWMTSDFVILDAENENRKSGCQDGDLNRTWWGEVRPYLRKIDWDLLGHGRKLRIARQLESRASDADPGNPDECDRNQRQIRALLDTLVPRS